LSSSSALSKRSALSAQTASIRSRICHPPGRSAAIMRNHAEPANDGARRASPQILALSKEIGEKVMDDLKSQVLYK